MTLRLALAIAAVTLLGPMALGRLGDVLRADVAAQTAVSQAAVPQGDAAASRAVLDRYCVTCHNQRLKTAGLALDTLDVGRVGDDIDIWEKAARKLRTREMPPPGAPRPDAGTVDAMVARLEQALDGAGR